MTHTFDPTKPVRTRDGRQARIVATDVKSRSGQHILALITDKRDYEYEATFGPNGGYLEGVDMSGRESENDLVNVPKQTIALLTVYPNGTAFQTYGSDVLPAGAAGHLRLTLEADKLVSADVIG